MKDNREWLKSLLSKDNSLTEVQIRAAAITADMKVYPVLISKVRSELGISKKRGRPKAEASSAAPKKAQKPLAAKCAKANGGACPVEGAVKILQLAEGLGGFGVLCGLVETMKKAGVK